MPGLRAGAGPDPGPPARGRPGGAEPVRRPGERASRCSTTPGCPCPTKSSTSTRSWSFEKEMLGLYVSDHPLVGAEAALRRHTDCTILGPARGGPGRDGPSAGHRRRTPRCGQQRERAGAMATAGRPRSWYGGRGERALGRRRRHRAHPPVHQEGRADGHLRPRGPAVVDRGLRLPSHHDRSGPPPGRRRRRVREGQARPRDEVPKIVCSELKRPQLTSTASEPLHVVRPC